VEAELMALLAGLLHSPPPEDPQQSDLQPNIVNLFTSKITATPPAPVLVALPVASPALVPAVAELATVKSTPWRSDRLAKKAKAQQAMPAKKASTKDLPVERAQGVLMSKWGILEETETPKEVQRKKYMKMYEGAMPVTAVAAVDELLDMGFGKKAGSGRTADAACNIVSVYNPN
jgi:hypothetical protein